jgi:hypothetical protein
LVTEPANADAVLVPAEEGAALLAGAELAGAVAGGAEVAGGALELDPELQAAAPAARQAPTAMNRHLEPALIRESVPAERPIAPSRLSAVDSPFTGLRTPRQAADGCS